MQITATLLREIAAAPAPLADQMAPIFDAQMEAAGLKTRLRASHFLAQSIYETMYLRRLTEDLDYTQADVARVFPKLRDRAAELAHQPEQLADAAYASRFGNADEASGDGWRYRGRGLFDLTFRGNYAEVGRMAQLNLVDNPDWVAQPLYAVQTALDFWRERNINSAADRDDVAEVTHIVNGGFEGLAARTAIKQRAFKLLAVT